MKIPFMKFYATEWLQDTRELSPATRGVWIDILCVLSVSEPRGELSLTKETWARKLSITIKEFEESLSELEVHNKPNFIHENNGNITLKSRRLIKERKYYELLTERQRRYNEKKRQYNAQYNANITQEVTHKTLDLQTLDVRLHTTHTPPTPSRGEDVWNSLEQFNTLWENYPSKIGRKQALKHFQASVKSAGDLDLISQALSNYLKSDRVKNGFVQNASTWFNNWKDWIDQPRQEMSSMERTKLWHSQGLSTCHGKKIFEDETEKKSRCSYCLIEQTLRKYEPN